MIGQLKIFVKTSGDILAHYEIYENAIVPCKKLAVVRDLTTSKKLIERPEVL